MPTGRLMLRPLGAGGGFRGGFYGMRARELTGSEDFPRSPGNLPSGYTHWQDMMSTEEQAARRQRSLGLGQIDFGLGSPLLMSAIIDQQRNRRRGYAGTLLTGGLGLDEERTRRKTLLGG